MADILASSKPGFNESNIVDSSKPGFVSSYDKSKGKDSTDESAEPKKETIASGKRIVEDTIKEELKKKPTTEEEKEVIANKKVTGCRMSLSKDSCIISIPNEIGIVTDYVFPKKDVQEVLLTVFTNTK